MFYCHSYQRKRNLEGVHRMALSKRELSNSYACLSRCSCAFQMGERCHVLRLNTWAKCFLLAWNSSKNKGTAMLHHAALHRHCTGLISRKEHSAARIQFGGLMYCSDIACTREFLMVQADRFWYSVLTLTPGTERSRVPIRF